MLTSLKFIHRFCTKINSMTGEDFELFLDTPHSFLNKPFLIIISSGDSKMKGRDSSSYSTASGAVISLSKWAVLVSGPWEGIFSCVGRHCAVADSNTQRASAPVPTTQKHTQPAGDVCAECPSTCGRSKNMLGPLICGTSNSLKTSTIFSLWVLKLWLLIWQYRHYGDSN